MTDGTSQGLFIVVAIVIFGIFTLLAYILFEDTLSPSLANMFSDATETANVKLKKPLKIEKVVNEDGTITLTAYNASTEMVADNIQMLSKVSGVNLLPNSDFKIPLKEAEKKHHVYWYTRGTDMRIDHDTTIHGNPTLRIDSYFKEAYQNDAYFDINNSIENGDKYMISFDAMSNEPTRLRVRFGVQSGRGAAINPVVVDIDTTPKRYTLELEKFPGNTRNVIFRTLDSQTLWITNIQVEFGTNASEWKPYGLDNQFDKVNQKLSMTIDKNGTFKFVMSDKNGNTYVENITITDF